MEPTAVTTNQATCPTLSRKRAGAPATRSAWPTPRGNRDRRTAEVDMSAPRAESNADGGHDDVHREQRDDAEHQRLVDGGADALGAAGDGEAAVAADQSGDQTERQRLHAGDHYLGQAGDQR